MHFVGIYFIIKLQSTVQKNIKYNYLFYFQKGLLRIVLRKKCGNNCGSFYIGADKSLARPGRKQTTATEDF
jgi:hypothetical protein